VKTPLLSQLVNRSPRDSYPPDRTPHNDNHVSSLDLKVDQVSVLNCSNNELVSIENLPKSITELHCDNNNIIAIDLMDLSELGKLSIKELR
jgi:Leucine-rich repeat (LRR) protein